MTPAEVTTATVVEAEVKPSTRNEKKQPSKGLKLSKKKQEEEQY